MGSVKKVFKDLRLSDLRVCQNHLKVLINHRLLGPTSRVSTKIYTGSCVPGAKVTMMAMVPAAKFLFVMLSDLIPYCQTFLISVLSGDPHSS